MKRIFFAVVCLTLVFSSFAQSENPVNWSYEAKKKSVDTYEIIVTADIAHTWHLYSQTTEKGGPIPTKIVFKANPLISKTGAIKEVGKLEKIFDKNFGINVLFYSDKVQFIQTVKLKSAGVKTNISGTVEYMVCDDSRCLPPAKKAFDLKIQ